MGRESPPPQTSFTLLRIIPITLRHRLKIQRRMLFQYAVQVLVAATCVSSAKIVDEALPDGFVGDLYRNFRPYLSVDTKTCCTPWPAVDGNGDARCVAHTLQDSTWSSY